MNRGRGIFGEIGRNPKIPFNTDFSRIRSALTGTGEPGDEKGGQKKIAVKNFYCEIFPRLVFIRRQPMVGKGRKGVMILGR